MIKQRDKGTQGRLDSFFKPIANPNPSVKRKNENEKPGGKNAKKPAAKGKSGGASGKPRK